MYLYLYLHAYLSVVFVPLKHPFALCMIGVHRLSVMNSSIMLWLIYEDRFQFSGFVVDLQIRHSAAESLAAGENSTLCVGVPLFQNLLRCTMALLYLQPRGNKWMINLLLWYTKLLS